VFSVADRPVGGSQNSQLLSFMKNWLSLGDVKNDGFRLSCSLSPLINMILPRCLWHYGPN